MSFNKAQAISDMQTLFGVNNSADDAAEGICDSIIDNYTAASGESLTETLYTDMRINGTTLQVKTRSFTWTDGVLTSVGSESSWTDVPVV
jgi:hypothetical protein